MQLEYNPDFRPYSGQSILRFWCQKVLPLVYDDSLSYYEVLCKVVNYLNTVITDLDATEHNVDQLKQAYDILVQFVDDKIGHIEEVVEDQLQQMLEDGDFDELISDLPKSDSTPEMDGTGSAGVSEYVSRGDHVHPKDTTKLNYVYFTGLTDFLPATLCSVLNSNMTSIPTGSSVVKVGSDTNASKVTLLVNKINNTLASAITTSPYDALKGLQLKCYNSVWYVLSESNYSAMNGKKIVIYGDSLSDETSQSVASLQPNWVALLRELLPNTTITNKALAGARFSGASPSIASIVDSETSIDADYIIVFGGINDFRHSADLGTIGAENSSTYCGSLEIIKNKFIELAPSAEVYFITPPKLNDPNPPVDHDDTKPLIVYRTAMTTFCSRYGYMLIDGYNFPLLNPFNLATKQRFQPDGIHPNTTYAPILCDYILDKLLSKGENTLAPDMCRINIASLANTGVDFTSTGKFVYADLDSCGKITITASGSFSATEGEPTTIMNLPSHMRPLTSGVVVMQSQIGSNYYAEYITINASGPIVAKRSPETGTQHFSFMVEFNTQFNGFNPNKT